MLDIKTTKALHQQTTELLIKFHVAEALQGVVTMARESKDRDLISAAEKEEGDYHHMLSFLQAKGPDKERGRMQDQLIKRLLQILDNSTRTIRLWHKKDLYAKTYNAFEGKTFEEVTNELWDKWDKELGKVERYDTQDLIFDFIWTMPQLKPKQTAAWYEFISRQDFLVQEHFVGAIIMSLWEYFDEEKLTLLTLFSESENKYVHATALIGFALMAQKYEKRIIQFKESLNLPTICTRNSLTLLHMMREMLLIRISAEALEKLHEFYDKFKYRIQKGILNPESEEAENETFEEEKAKAMQLLKASLREGLDMDMNHKMLIPQSKFLKNISHWWLPYDEVRPQIQALFTKENGEVSKGIKSIFNNDDCSANKYALCDMLLEHTKLQQLDAQIIEAQNQMDEFGELLSPTHKKKSSPHKSDTSLPVRKKMHNLKRFYGYSPIAQILQEEIKVPDILILINNNLIKEYFEKEQINHICDMMYDARYYSMLIPFLEEKMRHEGATVDTLMKLSICHSKEGNLKVACQYMEQAHFLDENNIDILEELSRIYKHLQKFEERLEILKELSKLSPEPILVDIEIANCYEDLRRYDEALPYLLKIDLFKEEGSPLIRSKIALCYAMQRNYEKAEHYLQKALDMNHIILEIQHSIAGFIYFEQGQWIKAVSFYRKMKINSFDTHCDFLRERGYSERDIQLLRDMILFQQWN